MGRGEDREHSEGLAHLDRLRAVSHGFLDTLDDMLLRESVQLRPVRPQPRRKVEYSSYGQTGVVTNDRPYSLAVNSMVDLGKRYSGVCNAGSNMGKDGWIVDWCE